jgi:hypothetical protein
MCVNALFSGSFAYQSIDNDFSLFERPQHYIRYIGMLVFGSHILELSPID